MQSPRIREPRRRGCGPLTRARLLSTDMHISKTAPIAALTFSLAVAFGAADASVSRSVHGIAIHGEPKYGADFTHFDYVNPDAPKGGSIRLAAQGTFDSFHPYIAKGNPGPSSDIETLLTSSADEPFTAYGLIAESLKVPEDRSWAIFNLRPEARWHDGEPITVEGKREAGLIQ